MTQDEMMKYFSGLAGADYSNKKPFFKFALKGDENFDPNFAPLNEQFDQSNVEPFTAGGLLQRDPNKTLDIFGGNVKSGFLNDPNFEPGMNLDPERQKAIKDATTGISDEDAKAFKDLQQEILKQNEDKEVYDDAIMRRARNKAPDVVPTKKEKEEKKKKEGAFRSLWNKFTDKDSSAPRNLLDFGLAMMANSKGAGNDFLGTVAQSVGDTVDKVDARKLAALETAKDNLAGKLERTKTISEIEDNIVDRYTSKTEDINGVKSSVVDWAKVSAAMDELDPDGDYFSKSYITEIAKNGFGMPAVNEDGQYELEVPTDNNQAFKYFKQMEYIGMMNPDKEPKDIEVVVGNRIMSLQMIMDEQLKQMQG